VAVRCCHSTRDLGRSGSIGSILVAMMVEDRERETDEELLEQLYHQVGHAPEGELVSEELLRERREEAFKEEADD